MEKHVTAVAVLHIAFGALGLCGAAIVFLAVVGGGLLSGDIRAIAITSTVGIVASAFMTITSLPGLIGGNGVLGRRRWARVLVMVVGALDLFSIPFGTILGVYTLWILMKDETARLFVPA